MLEALDIGLSLEERRACSPRRSPSGAAREMTLDRDIAITIETMAATGLDQPHDVHKRGPLSASLR